LSAGARRTGKDLTSGPGSSVERAARWSDAAWERRVRQRCWAAERAQGEEGVAAEQRLGRGVDARAERAEFRRGVWAAGERGGVAGPAWFGLGKRKVGHVPLRVGFVFGMGWVFKLG